MRNYRMIKQLALAGAALLAGPALAQTVTISTATTNPVATGTASNGAPADVTLATGGSVIVASGTAVTINSANTLTNGTTITSNGASSTTAVLVDVGNGLSGASLVNNGAINVAGTGGSGNIGIWVNGSGLFTGSIDGNASGSISVAGTESTGVLIATPMAGNITLRSINLAGANSEGFANTAAITGNIITRGAIVTSGAGSTAIQIAAPITGRFTQGSSLVAGADASFNSSNQRVPVVTAVAGVQIGASISGGFVNDRYFVDGTGVIVPAPATGATNPPSLVTATITSYGTAPALLVAPLAPNTSVTLGAFGSGDDGFGLINRGTLDVIGRDAGLAATAVRIGGAGLAAGTVTLQGGMANQLRATITANSVDARAIGIDVQAGASVPLLANGGDIAAAAAQTPASGTVAAGAGGAAVGINIGAGASVAAISNTGTIQSVASAGNASTAILDTSGTLASVANTGTILARTTGTGALRAIDVSASTGAFTLASNGTITGDVLGAQGADTILLSGGVLTGNLQLGSGANVLAMSGGARITGAVNSSGRLALSLAGATTLDLSTGNARSLSSLTMADNSVLVIGARPAGQAGLDISGTATFSAAARLKVAVTNVTVSQNITLLNAAGGINAASAATLLDTSTVPFLYTLGGTSVGANTITLSLNRKSAAALGLATGVTNFFDQSLVALAGDTSLGPAIGNLADQASFLAAYRQLRPATYNPAALRMAVAMSDAGFGAIANRLEVIRLARPEQGGEARRGTGMWVQQYGNFLKQNDAANVPGFSGNMLGLSIGADKPMLGLDALGVAVNAGWSDIGYGGIGGRPLLIDTQQLDIYGAKRFGGMFVALRGGAGLNNYRSNRTLSIGTQSGSIIGNWKGYSLTASGTVGYTFTLGRLEITPSNTINWLRLQQNGFTETGAGALALTMDSNRQQSITNTTRLNMDYVAAKPTGGWRFGGTAAYVAQLQATPLSLSGRFADKVTVFTLNADNYRANEAQFGGHIAYTGPGWAAFAGFDRRQSSGFTSQTVSASFRMIM